MAWYSADNYEQFMIRNRMTGPYAPFYWSLIFCNIVAPQILWLKRVRMSVPILFVMSLVVNVGMWLERFVICRDQSAPRFSPLLRGVCITPRSMTGAFTSARSACSSACFFCSIRFLPMISIFDTAIHSASSGSGGAGKMIWPSRDIRCGD